MKDQSSHRADFATGELTPDAQGAHGRHPLWLILTAVAVLGLATLACSVGQAVVGNPADAPTPTKTKQPTFTPLPGAHSIVLTPVAVVRGELPPGVTVEPPGGAGASGRFTGTLASGTGDGETSLVVYATSTAPPSPTPEPTNTPGPPPTPTLDFETNRPTREAGPRALPTPYVVVNSTTLNGRRGPAVTFERLGQAAQGDELMILARSTDGKWWQVCCLANQPVWVSADLVTAMGPVDTVPALTPPPTPRPVPPPPPAPTSTPAPTPPPPFDIARGPERYVPRDDGRFVLRSKIYEGTSPYEKPLPGYVVKVFRNGADVTPLNETTDYATSRDVWDYTNFGKTNNYQYNYKFEMGDGGEADWEIYLAKPDGFRVSPITQFTTKGDMYRNLEVYIAYWLAR
jgi:hypothetical protein